MTGRRSAVIAGLSALAKSLLVVLGVPFAVLRLWTLSPTTWPTRLAALHDLASWAHLVLVLVMALWLASTWTLGKDVALAFRSRDARVDPTWSSRWAIAIAGLLLLASAGTLNGHRPTPTGLRSGARPVAAKTVDRSLGRATVRPGDDLGTLARRVSGGSGTWPAVARLNMGTRQIDGSRFVDPNLIRSDWRLLVPGPARLANADTIADAHRPARRGEPLGELALLGLGILGTSALVRRSEVLRRLRRSVRRPGDRHLARPPAELVQLLPFADSVLLDWIDDGNRLLWHSLRLHHRPAPEVRLVRAGPEGVEFLLAEDAGLPPAPFVARGSGRWWALPPEIGPDEAAEKSRGCGRLVPWLVPVGDDGDAVYLVALAPGRRLGLIGSPAEVAAVANALVLALRTLPWAEELEVELLGADPPDDAEHAAHIVASSPASLGTRLGRTGGTGCASRLSGDWRREPLVVVASGSVGETVLGPASAVAGIVAPGEIGTEHLVISARRGVLEPYGLELKLPAATTDQRRLANRLLVSARRDWYVPVPPASVTPRGTRSVIEVLAPFPTVHLDLTAATTRVCDVVTELLAYLLFHGRVATRQEIAAAMRPTCIAATLELAVAALVEALGTDDRGRPRLRVGEALELSADVDCDWYRLERLADQAEAAPVNEAIPLLDQALALVHGLPFSGLCHGYRWFLAEGFEDLVVTRVVDATHHLATLALAAGDDASARAALSAGRLVDPDSELLARDLMAVHGAVGDRARSEEVWQELETRLEALGTEPAAASRALHAALPAVATTSGERRP